MEVIIIIIATTSIIIIVITIATINTPTTAIDTIDYNITTITVSSYRNFKAINGLYGITWSVFLSGRPAKMKTVIWNVVARVCVEFSDISGY